MSVDRYSTNFQKKLCAEVVIALLIKFSILGFIAYVCFSSPPDEAKVQAQIPQHFFSVD